MRMSIKHANNKCMFGILTIDKIILQGDQAYMTPSSKLILDSKMLFWVGQVQAKKNGFMSFTHCSNFFILNSNTFYHRHNRQ